MGEWISMIGNVGFPIVVTLYLLHRIESKLDGVIVAIEKLPQQMTKYEAPHETK
ncbi:YvrJ family protein [Bacillus pseudomycoides]|uniref:YvrJ family protein n=1 Tax=Bacillus TaxID=1386 RepID=UPI000BEB950E|nr:MULTISPECIES: YvrJ family protein [Bacillus]MCX2825533.1 YvrJ family protein [Bacillus sp. DHT2]MDR4918352.1 YvrJ family protein [Bacillus pseudomycoides]PDY00748.1 YvrJ family protein [Bacillus pseudomycoides]PEK81267.1 YvrJ family protein [Bacillus pseudomycoides]PEN11860.1 YvrJ family protein [Bacillus pseudomycoides]